MPSKKELDLIQTSRRFFGYALKHSPEELYEEAHSPPPHALGIFVADYLVHKAIDNKLFTSKELGPVRPLFDAAINNTRDILIQGIVKRNAPLELIPRIARDERTIVNIARLAMHSEEFMQTAISPLVDVEYVTLSDDLTHIEVTDHFVDSVSGGCPFASTPEHIVSPDPLFRRTIHLAGDLTYLAYKK